MVETVKVHRTEVSRLLVQGDSTAQVHLKPNSQRVTVVQSASPIPVTGTGGSGPANYTHIQPSAQATWMIPHNLGRRPAVTVLDSEGRVVIADVQHLSDDVVSITFSVPMVGTAELT